MEMAERGIRRRQQQSEQDDDDSNHIIVITVDDDRHDAIRCRHKKRFGPRKRILVIVAATTLFAIALVFVIFLLYSRNRSSSSSGYGNPIIIGGNDNSPKNDDNPQVKVEQERARMVALDQKKDNKDENPALAGNKEEQQQHQEQQHPQQLAPSSFTTTEHKQHKYKKYCDNESSFRKECNPKPATCFETKNVSSSHGIGNAIMVIFSKAARDVYNNAAFNNSCAPVLRTNNNTRYLNYNEIPNITVAGNKNDCIVYAITQPRGIVQTKVDEILLQSSSSSSSSSSSQLPEVLPLVALHVRTGWADELARRKWAWDGLNDTHVCNDPDVMEYVAMEGGGERKSKSVTADPYSMAVTDEDFLLQEHILDPLRAKANKKFGKNQWRLFVASDAPGIKDYTANYLKDDVYANKVLMTTGTIGHNHDGYKIRSPEDSEAINVNAYVDLIVMSEASLFAYLPSKFPVVAAMRAQCDQEVMKPGGGIHPRHALSDIGGIATEFIPALRDKKENENKTNENKNNNKHFDKQQYKKWFDEMTKILAQNKGIRPKCLDSKKPVEACLCWVKRAHA